MPKRKRVALVLEGGGALGAWQFGVLEEFAKAKLKFSAIAGTSVGALNGFLLAAGAMDQGRQLWRDITYDNVFPLKRPRILSLALAFVLLPARALLAQAYGLPHRRDHRTVMARVMRALPGIVLVTFIAAHALITGDKENKSLMGGMLILLLVFLPLLAAVQARVYGTYSFHLLSGLFVYLPGTLLMLCLATVSIPFAWKCILVPLAFIAFPAGMRLVEELLLRATIMRSDPLAERIDALAKNRNLTTPMIVTVAEITEIGLFSKELRPHYYHLLQTPRSDWGKVLLASASLPVGLVSPVNVEIHGREFRAVDGGVADNRPLLPVLNGHDEILVLCFDKKMPDGSEDIKRYKDVSPAKVPVIRYFCPSVNVGGYFGILRFQKEFVQRLLLQGSIDGQRFVQQLS